ncbi:efflux transporter periplasmic adaptor subunit [Aliivibrio sp. 1S165]|uniref:efflux RND transporter periplasmic adaptor subunit n=1 Tax=unclassified Aliivibrio TaxID=2645654 RepID=UPI00080E374B|nr:MULTISPECIES: efflux RND transporter periplasmic adaptor subunit [unclassified Aliivibrio]OCH16951.1 efflux transporter periplasmic adaptor subunit [Aliivibrio sp. 1S165]OCH33383.1 efflux transporter periplasmic adaptor subunit [Aliivibrio sp. 1S175]
MGKYTPAFFSYLVHRPWIISVFLFLSLFLWIMSGPSHAENSEIKQANPILNVPLANVIVERFQSIPTHKTISLYGRTAPDRKTILGAQVAAQIESFLVRKGERVKKDQPIAHLDMADLDLQLSQVKAIYSVRLKEFNAAKQLRRKGLQGDVAFSKAQASLAEAKARVRNAELILKNTTITAPFDGVVEHLFVEVGDFVSRGDPVAKVVVLDPLVIEVNVSERHIEQLVKDQKAEVIFINDTFIEGDVRYISRVSSSSTNTFAVEIEIPNIGAQIFAGMSAEVVINLALQPAIKVSPAMLALNEGGDLGVKTVIQSEGNSESDLRVKFIPIQLVKAEDDGIWLTGLGDEVDMITVGQGFVRDGDFIHAQRK